MLKQLQKKTQVRATDLHLEPSVQISVDWHLQTIFVFVFLCRRLSKAECKHKVAGCP